MQALLASGPPYMLFWILSTMMPTTTNGTPRSMTVSPTASRAPKRRCFSSGPRKIERRA